ncbi:MAG: RidA family protein [Hyphomicrobiales bacterium]
MITRTNPPELAPAPPGYSHVVEVGGGRLIHIAGQVALDREGNLVGKGDFVAQADQVFRNLGLALAAAGCTVQDLVKITVFLRDMTEIRAFIAARNRFLGTLTPSAAPAMTLVEVSGLFRDDVAIEVEAVAAL